MFNVKEVIREVEAEKKPESEGTPRAKGAKGAKNRPEISTISTISTPPASENGNVSKLESLRLIYGDSNQKDDDPVIPFTDHEIAEHKIDTEVHRDDRAFVRQRLIGIYGAKRLELVDQYLKHFNEGSNSVEEAHKKSNAGRFKANTWLREHSIKSKVDGSRS
jgi:hypothetical protein